MSRSAEDLCYLAIREAGALLRDKKLSPVELTRAHLDRVEQLDGTLRAFITVLGDSALDQARAAENEILQGAYRGPLHGIPIGLKDLYDTAGVRTTAGSRVNAGRVPTVDSTVAARFTSAGAILLGKLAMNEFAVGGPDPSAGFPVSRNPWNTARSTGGSSTGSAAAVAAGLCMGAMGSCTRGSIRAPASFCNIVGLKPTYGRVSRAGVIPLSWTLDHCGPMTRTVEDAALMLEPIAGRDPGDPTTAEVPVQAYASELERDVRGLRSGVPRHFFFATRPEVDAETQTRADEALKIMEGLGASVEEVEIPALHQSDAAALVILLGEGYAYHERTLRARPHDYGDLLRTELQVGALFTSTDYIQAQRLRSALKRQYAEALHRVDVIASPTFAIAAPPIDAPGLAVTAMPSFTGPYNLTGLPAVSVPCGFTAEGLPVGLQIAGRPFDESMVLRAAYAYEQASRWFERHPPE